METKQEDLDVSWVVTTDGGGTKCQRCGNILTIRLPIAVALFVRRLNLFSDLHATCEEPKFDCKGLPVLVVDPYGRPMLKDASGQVLLNVCGHSIPSKGDLPKEPCGRVPEHSGRHARVPSAKRRAQAKVEEAGSGNDD